MSYLFTTLLVLLAATPLKAYGKIIGSALGIIFVLAYPIVKSDFLKSRIAQARRKLKKAGSLDPAWEKIPEASFIHSFYPKLLTAISANELAPVSSHLTESFISQHQEKFKKWNKQKIGYLFAWLEINHVEVVGVKDEKNNAADKVKIFISGRSVDYIHELGTSAAMGAETQRKKEFQDVLVFKRHTNGWLLDKVYRDAYFWQI